ncbi:hypothetical protein [Lentzea guizhouensis]|nr:hypothetical protein [Lentzea guizhouensis]
MMAASVLASSPGHRVPFAVAGAVFPVAAVLCLVSVKNFRG